MVPQMHQEHVAYVWLQFAHLGSFLRKATLTVDWRQIEATHVQRLHAKRPEKIA